MATGRGDELRSEWATVSGLIPRVEHGTGGDALSLVSTDFFFGATGGTPASAPVTGIDVAADLGTASAQGAALSSVTGLDAAAALASLTAHGAASATATGFVATVTDGTASAIGAARVVPSALAVGLTLGTVTATGDAPVEQPTTGGGSRFMLQLPRVPARVIVRALPRVRLRLGRVVTRGGAKPARAVSLRCPVTTGAVRVPWTSNPTDDEMLTHHLMGV